MEKKKEKKAPARLCSNRARAVGQFRLQPYFLIAKVSLLYFRIITSLPGSKPLALANEVEGRGSDCLPLSYRGALLFLSRLLSSGRRWLIIPIIISANLRVECMRILPQKKGARKRVALQLFPRRGRERTIFVSYPFRVYCRVSRSGAVPIPD